MQTIEIIHHEIFNKKGGLGIMVRHTRGDSFVEIATSYCSVDDQYSKKVAVARLKHSFSEGLVIQFPVLIRQLRFNMTHKDLRNILMNSLYITQV